MKLGIFSKIYNNYCLDEAFLKIREHGIKNIQFNMSNVGLESLPEHINDNIIKKIKHSQNKYGISIPVISGTFNTLELDKNKNAENLRRFINLLNAAKILNIECVSISTGSFNQKNFWRSHPENQTEKAWELLMKRLEQMLIEAEKRKIIIVVEPEQANVVQSESDVMRLMEYYKSNYLRVLYDPSNLMTIKDIGQEIDKIKYSLNVLRKYIVVAHLKDFNIRKEKIVYTPLGRGLLPINLYLEELGNFFNGSVIMHDLKIEDIQYALEQINMDLFL